MSRFPKKPATYVQHYRGAGRPRGRRRTCWCWGTGADHVVATAAARVHRRSVQRENSPLVRALNVARLSRVAGRRVRRA